MGNEETAQEERDRAIGRFFDALASLAAKAGQLLDVIIEQEQKYP